MAFDPDAYLAEGGGVKETPFDPDSYLGIEKPVGTSFTDKLQTATEELEAGIGRAGGAFAKSAVGSARMITDLFGANNKVSKEIAGVEDYIDQFTSAQAKQDKEEINRLFQEAEGKGLGAKVLAGLKAVAVSPETLGPEMAGYMLPSLAVGVLTGGASIPVQIGAQATMGAAQAAGSIKGDIYQSVRDYSREQGLDEVEADRAATEAQSYGGKNLDLILANAGIGALAASTGAERIATRILTGRGQAVTKKTLGQFLKQGAAAGGVEALTEGTQEAAEQISQNIAMQREGKDVPTFQNVPQVATMGAVAGGIIGGGLKGIEFLSAEQKAEQDINRSADREARSLSATDSTTKKVINDLNQSENAIDSLRQELDTLEPTDPKAQQLRMRISEEQKKATGLKQSLGEELSEPITEAERQQAELAKAIVEEPAPTEALPVPPAPVEQVVTPPVEVAPAIEEEPMSVSDEKEFAELNDLMGRKGQAENKVKGVKFTKQDQSRYQNLLTKFRDRLIETTDPKNDPVVGTDINGTPIQQSNKGTFYTFENGRVRTGPAFSESTPAPTISEPAPVTEQAAPAEAPAPEVAPAQVTLWRAERRVGDIKEGKSLGTFLTSSEDTAYSLADMQGEVEQIDVQITKPLIIPSGENNKELYFDSQQVNEILKNAGVKYKVDPRYGYDEFWRILDSEGTKMVNAIKKAGYDSIQYPEFLGRQNQTTTLLLQHEREGQQFKSKIAAPTPAVSETIAEAAATPKGIAVGNRVKLGKSPQTYTIEEVIPQSANDKKFGEQYYNVKNERTGKTQVVEKNDMKPVSSRRRKMASEPDPLPENERYGQVKLNQRIQRYFGGKIPDRVYVVDDAVDKEKKYQAAYYPDLGILIVNNAYIKKNANVGDIIAHELGHYAFGDKKFKAAFDNFYNSLSPEDKAKIDKIIEESYNEETEQSQIEERNVIAFTAYTIVNPQRRSLWNAVLDALKAFANKVFGKNFQMSDPNRTALAMLATAKKRFAVGEEIVREEEAEGPRKMAARREQIMREKVGPEVKTPEGIIAKTQELLRKQFDPTKVSEQNTTDAFRAIGRLTSKQGNAFAEELNDLGRVEGSEVSMGAALFVNDLFEYSIRLAAEGQKMMLGVMMTNINKLPTGAMGATGAGQTLRARLELSQRFLTMAQAEQDAYTNYVAEFIYGPNPTKEQIQSIKDAYAAVEKTKQITEEELTDEITAVGDRTGTDLVGRINEEFTKATEKSKEKRKTEEEELDTEYKKVQKQADAEIEKLAKIQSDTPSFDPAAARQTVNDVRAIVSADLKQKPDMGRKAPWKSMLVAKLQEAGVELTAAETLADIVWRQHEINSLSRELSSINKAIEKGPISEIVKAIKNTPLEDQQKPNWRYEVMRDYLRKAGLTIAQSERIAKLMDISLQKRFTMAQEQAFTDAISKSAPWKTGDTRSRRAFQKVLQALRAGALDPARNVLSDMAALNGWTGFTPEQYKALLKNDAILSDPKAGELKKAEAYKAIQDVISKAKLPIRARNVIGQYYDAQALSGIPTLTVNAFSPIAFAMRNAIIEIGSGTLKGNPKAITNAATALVDSIKSWANTVAFSFKNNVTVYSNVDYIVNDDNLLRLYRRGVDQFKGGKTARDKADGVKNMMVGMMDYVRRILNALDYGAIASLQNQNISKYAMAVMKRQGMSTKEGNEMFAVMMKAKNDFYLQQIAIGTDKNKASILADEFYISSWNDALTKAGVEKSDIKQAMDAAINDALSSVGRNRQSLDSLKDEATKLKDAGVSSMPALWLLESMANAANQSNNQILKLFSRVIYGFAIVPARVIRETAWFSPYGFVRFGYDAIAKKMGKTSPYAQSLGTDVQYSQRLNEAIAGTVALIALASLRGSSTDEPEEDEFKIVFTGNGPKRIDDPQFYDSWYKAGNKPNSMIVSFGKTKIPFNMMRGFEAFTWPAMMLGAVDDLEIRKKQKRDTNTNTQIQDASIVAGFVFDAALRRGPYAFTTKSLFGTYGDIGVEGVAKGLTFPAKTLIPVLGTSLASNLSNFINDPIDRRTLDGAVWSNIPFIGPAVAPKSLNAFGEPALSTDFASKMFKLGVPLVYDIPTDRESIKLHELVLKQGGGPSIPTRNQLAQRLDRQPTNKEYEMFMKEYSAKITSDMKRRYEELSNKTPDKYSKSIEKIGDRARDIAERKVRDAAKKP